MGVASRYGEQEVGVASGSGWNLWVWLLGEVVRRYIDFLILVQSNDDNCGEWVECMSMVSGCGEQEVGVASGSGWNLWVWLLGVVVRRYIHFLILLIRTPLVSVLFYSSIPTFCSFFSCLSFFIYIP